MPYESKPMKKQWIEVEGKMTPIILPQIWSHEKQDWVVTSEQNPLPTQVTGSIVEEVEIFNSVKIRDTSSHWELVDLSRFKSFTLIARSTLNEYPTIAYRTPDTATPNRVFKNGEWVSTGQITIEDTSNRGYLLNSFWTEFTDTPYASIAFRVRCDVAPTQGEFSLLAWGVLR